LFPDPDPEEPGQKQKIPTERICRSSQALSYPLDRRRSREPLRLADGNRIQVDLKQEEIIDSKPALISARAGCER